MEFMVKVLMKSKMAVYVFLSRLAPYLNLTPVSGPTLAKNKQTLKAFLLLF